MTYRKEYYIKNKDKIKEKQKKYDEKNKDRIKEYKKEYRKKNKSKIKKTFGVWLEKNKGKDLEYHRNYIKTHKHIYSNAFHKRRLKMKFTDIDNKWLKQLYDNTDICEVCNRKMKKKSIDHIIPINVGGLHIKSNVRIICLKCNQQRPKNGSDIIQFRLL